MLLSDFFAILLYALGSILLVVLIVLGIRLIQTVDRANRLLDDLEEKSKSLNALFVTVDSFSNAVAAIGDRVIDGITGVISSFFHKRKKKKYNEEEIEDYE